MKKLYEHINIYLQSRGDEVKRNRLFKAIWERYYPSVCLYVYQFTGNRETAEDLGSEIVLKVFKKIHTYNPVYSFSTWIYRISRNHCFDFMKRQKEEGLESCPVESLSYTKSPSESVLLREEYEIVNQYIRGLTPVDRELFYLRYSEELSCKEIAGILEMPGGTVRYKLTILRNELKEYRRSYYER